MPLERSEIQHVTEICNNLNILIPIGCLYFYGTSALEHSLDGTAVGCSSWKWFDAHFLHYVRGTSLHPVLQALVYLVRFRYLSATYRYVPIHSQVSVSAWKVRIYAVPMDINGARFLRVWRANLRSRSSSNFMRHWSTVYSCVDFSADSWSRTSILPDDLSLSNGAEYALIQCILTEHESVTRAPHSYHHLQRWLMQKTFTKSSTQQLSLESVVHSVYSRISSPSFAESDLPSKMNSATIPSPDETIVSLLRGNSSNFTSIKGIKTDLYPYQLRSVCKMYEKESTTSRKCIPHFIKLRSPTNSTYYFNILDNSFYSMPELYLLPKGGILAENMGLGKTLICLALICLSKHEMSSVPDEQLLHEKSQSTTSCGKAKPLTDMCANLITMKSLPWKFFEDDLPSSVVDRILKHPGHFIIAKNEPRHDKSLRGNNHMEYQETYKTLYMCSSTLVIIPGNLLHQWNEEVKRHVSLNFLKQLYISDRFKTHLHSQNADYSNTLPQDIKMLISYDLVIISSNYFSRMCSDSHNILKSIYWKRLIIDEGHSMSSPSSNLTKNCKSLYAERRWAVSGTPTSGLTNLHMNEEDTQISGPESPRKRRKYVIKSKFSVRDDLVKLGNLVSNYFKIEPFYSQPHLWTSTIIKSLGNSYQATAQLSLQNLLDSLMVRHGQAQVEKDLSLPQLHHEAVFLEPSYLNKLSINLFTSVLAVNAVSSERVGSDYMFDSNNRQQLRRLVNNLQLSTFYWTGFKVEDVESLIGITKHCLQRQLPNGLPKYDERDLELLRVSMRAAETALSNARWRSGAELHEMQLYVSGLPLAFSKAFASGKIKDIGVYGGPHLTAVQQFFYKNRYLDVQGNPHFQEKLATASRSFWNNYWEYSKDNEKGKFAKHEGVHKYKTNENDVKHSRENADRIDGNPSPSYQISTTSPIQNIDFQPDGPKQVINLKNSMILGTASSKLSYLASKLVGHQFDGIKSIVFFEYEDNAYYLTELLDILGVNYILYATFIEPERRPNNLQDFSSHDTAINGGITLVMDLKLASHGLTIISATRVYFINPVWQRSVEAQAIKRAHRIGQTKEVFVETLVLRGTLEEEIYRRRHSDERNWEDAEEQDETDHHQKHVVDDMRMQDFILRHTFLPVAEDEKEYSEFIDPSHDTQDSHSAASIKNQMEDSMFSLPRHQRYVCNDHSLAVRKWTMQLFNPNNIQKFNDSKRTKADIEQLNIDFVAEDVKRFVPTTTKFPTSSNKRVSF